MKYFFMIIAALLLLIQESGASIDFYQIEVDKLYETCNKEYILKFKPLKKMIGVSRENVQIILHIRFNEKCVTDLIQSDDLSKERNKYNEAVKELFSQISKSKSIMFGLKSGKGFHRIPGKDNEYQCDNLGIVIVNQSKIVYAIHSNIGSGYCSKKP